MVDMSYYMTKRFQQKYKIISECLYLKLTSILQNLNS